MDNTEARYRAEMERSRHTVLTPEEILLVLERHLDKIRGSEDDDAYTEFVALMNFRNSITSGMDFKTLMAALNREK